MFNIKKIKDINMDYNIPSDYDIAISFENLQNIENEFDEKIGKLKKELLKISEIVYELLNSKEEVGKAEMRAEQLLKLKKDEDIFVRNRLAILDDLMVLEHLMNSDKRFYPLISNFERKVDGYIGDVEHIINNVKAVKNITNVESEMLKHYISIYNNLIIYVDNLKKELKLEFNKINTYIQVFLEFDFESYEESFKSYNFN